VTTYLGILLVAFLITHLLTPLMCQLAFKLGALDVPGERKIHSRITPRLGGLAVFSGFWGAVALGAVANPRFWFFDQAPVWGLAIGSGIIVCVSFYDDVFGVPWFIKLSLQTAAAVVAFLYGVRFSLVTDVSQALFGAEGAGWQLGEVLSLVGTVVWIVGVCNAMNFIDGIDALAGGLSFIVSVTLFIVAIHLHQMFYAALYVALIGATLAFGRYNKFPAQVFLGDTGSTFLGFSLACISIMACHKSTTVGIVLIPVVALGVPISDTTYVILRRWVQGKSALSADRGHVYHRLLELGYTPKEVVWILYVVCIALSFCVFFLINAHSEFAALIVVLMSVGAYAFAKKLQLLEPQDKGQEGE